MPPRTWIETRRGGAVTGTNSLPKKGRYRVTRSAGQSSRVLPKTAFVLNGGAHLNLLQELELYVKGPSRWKLLLHSSTTGSRNLATGAGRCSRKCAASYTRQTRRS